MKRTLAIVLAAAVVGALAGGVIGLMLAGGERLGGHDDTAGRAVADRGEGSDRDHAFAVFRHEGADRGADLQAATPRAVAVISDTQTRVIPPTLFTPSREGAGRRARLGLRDRPTGRHRHERPRRRRQRRRCPGRVQRAARSYPAKIVGVDPSRDIAVVRVTAPASALHPLVFGDSGSIGVGDAAYAIGNPFGLDRTMTAGIVSAVGREIRSSNGLTIPNVIQTDAWMNHGNSGGLLFDRFGHVIGVNAQIEGGTVDGNVGIGFAIPGTTARSVAMQLLSSGHVEHPWLGLEIEPIDPVVANAVRGLPAHGVVVVRVVKGSPAAKAGLRPSTQQVTVNGVSAFSGGDSIVAVDGARVDDPAATHGHTRPSRPATRSPSRWFAPESPGPSTSRSAPSPRSGAYDELRHHGRARKEAGQGHRRGRPPALSRRCRGALMASGQVEIVAEAEDGRTALAGIREHLPDVALLDYKLPELDGVAVINAVAREQLATRVLLVSAFTDSGVVYKALETGAAGFVSKEAKREQIVDAVLACARGDNVVPPDLAAGLVSEIRLRKRDDAPALTPREQEILHLIAAGKSLPEIAKELFLGLTTVKTHVQHLYAKLGVSDRAAAVASAMRRGLIE